MRTDKPSGSQLDTLREYRSVPFVDMESAPDGGSFVGYAAVFDKEADLGSFTESVQRGAFRKSLASGNNVPMLWDHQDQWPPFAVTRSGTLRLAEDTKGLRVEADIAPRHPMGEYLREGVKRGDIDGMSWGFVAGPGNSRLERRGSKPHRSLLNFKSILDVSPTWDKTYADTEAAFRSLRMLEEVAHDLDLDAAGEEERAAKAYTAAERDEATTMPDGSFPIDNVADLKRAIQSVGRAKDQAAARAWIKKRARELGATDLVPAQWRSNRDFGEHVVEEEAQHFDDEAPITEPEVNEDQAEDRSVRDLVDDEHSGVAARAAARRRRLHMMGISIPQEYRSES